jgi:NAD+ diphosphatase
MPGLMSALAGFVEPGETLEEAVRREVREEAGLELRSVTYRTSQPWPFPSSLMLGFRAEARGGEMLRFDQQELEDARWFSRQEIADIRSLGLRLPFRGTIARALIEAWLAESEAGTA